MQSNVPSPCPLHRRVERIARGARRRAGHVVPRQALERLERIELVHSRRDQPLRLVGLRAAADERDLSSDARRGIVVPLDGLAHERHRVVHRVAAVVDDDGVHLRRGIWIGIRDPEEHEQAGAEGARRVVRVAVVGQLKGVGAVDPGPAVHDRQESQHVGAVRERPFRCRRRPSRRRCSSRARSPPGRPRRQSSRQSA